MANKAAKKDKGQEPVVLRIKQVRSGSGRPETHRATLRALGLRHHQHTVYQQDNPAIRGMIFQVRHLVDVQEVAAGEA